MDAERQPVAIAGNVFDQLIERVGAPAHEVQDRPEHFLREVAGAIELYDRRRHECARRWQWPETVPTEADAALTLHVGDPAIELVLRLSVDHRPHMGRRRARVAKLEL